MTVTARRRHLYLKPAALLHTGYGICLLGGTLLLGTSDWISEEILLLVALGWFVTIIGLARTKDVAYLIVWTLAGMLLVGFYSRVIALHFYAMDIKARTQFQLLDVNSISAALREITFAYLLCAAALIALSRKLDSRPNIRPSAPLTEAMVQKLSMPALVVSAVYFLISIVLTDPRSALSTGSLLGLLVRSLPTTSCLAVFALALAHREIPTSRRRYLPVIGLSFIVVSDSLNGKRGIFLLVLLALLLAKIVVEGRQARIGLRFLTFTLLTVALLPSLLTFTLQARERTSDDVTRRELSVREVSSMVSQRTGAFDSYWTVRNVTPNQAVAAPTPSSLLITTFATLIPSDIQSFLDLDPRPTSGVIFAQRFQGKAEGDNHAGAYTLPGLLEDMYSNLWVISFLVGGCTFFFLMRGYQRANTIWQSILLLIFVSVIIEGNIDAIVGSGFIGLLWIWLATRRTVKSLGLLKMGYEPS